MPENEDVQDAVQVPSGDDQLEFNLGEGEQGAEVEIAEDGTAKIAAVDEEEAKIAASESKKTPERGTQEHEEYSNKVKKRIEKMTAKLRESERREQAALEYAKQVQANLQQMQARVQTLDQGYITESKGRIDSQIAIAEANLQNAIEQNDGKAVVESQKLLSQLMIQQDQINRAAAQRPQAQAPVQQAYQQPVYQQPPQQAPRGPDEKAERWAEENEWFGTDEVMTNGTFAIHHQLEREGFDLSSDEYYDELNRRVRKEFPHKFRKPQVNTNVDAPGIAPATRGLSVSQTGRRTIKLTPSEVAMAKRIGVPLEEYAKYVRR